MPILYDLNILGLKYSPLKMTIPQMQSLSTIWFQMSPFIRSVSDHVKCDIQLKVSTMGVNSCVVLVVLVVAMVKGAKN